MPWRLPRRLSRRSGEPSGTMLTLTSLKKERYDGDPSRDSLEKLVRMVFWSNFEACAQERTCEKPVKTNGFCRFFVSCHFFERNGQLERKTFEKSEKSTLRGSKIDSRSTKFDKCMRGSTNFAKFCAEFWKNCATQVSTRPQKAAEEGS